MNSEFALILEHKAPIKEVNEIKNCLEKDNLFSYYLSERENKPRVLFIKLKNYYEFLREAERLRYEKVKIQR